MQHLICLVALIAGTCLGCSARRTPATVAPPPAQPTAPALSERDADVLEVALRDRLKHADADTTIFISLGAIPRWRDPPSGFLHRLDDLPFQFRPVSDARLPGRNEMETPTRYRGVEDPATGKRSWIYWAQIVQWVSDTKVRVNTGVWSGPLGGGGSTQVFELRDGRWEWTGAENFWLS